MTSQQLAAAYEAKRAAANKPVRVSHNGNGTYSVAPLRSLGCVPYTITARELRAKLAA